MSMRSIFYIFVVACMLACAFASTRLTDAPKTLVLFEDAEFKNTHSDFLQSLVDLGHSLTYSNVKEDTTTLKAYGKYNFDNVILCAASTEELGGGYIKAADLNDFVANGGSLLLAANSGLSESQRAFANSFGIDFDENESQVLDTSLTLPADDRLYTYDVEDERPIISVNVPVQKAPTAIIGNSDKPRTLLFRGLGQMVVQGSEYARAVVTANPSSVSIDSARNAMLAHGHGLSLISAVQTAMNSRVLVVGSDELFSNEFFSHSKGDNREILTNAVQWLVHARGYLRAQHSRHDKQVNVQKAIPTNAASPSTYRLKDDIVYAVDIEEYDGVSKKWVPYVSDKVLFETIMLDPYVRQQLPYNKETQAYQLSWRVPDVQGIYKFRTSINQFAANGATGVSFLENIDVVPIHPFRHDDYPRFVFAAYPYYIGAFSVMVAFFVFSAMFLYRK